MKKKEPGKSNLIGRHGSRNSFEIVAFKWETVRYSFQSGNFNLYLSQFAVAEVSNTVRDNRGKAVEFLGHEMTVTGSRWHMVGVFCQGVEWPGSTCW